MTATLTCPNNTRRLRLVSAAEANATGKAEAAALLIAIASRTEESPADLLNDALGEIIGLAVENRFDEFSARLGAFCEVIGPELRRAADLEGKCAQLSASLNRADLELAVRDLELQFMTETEGGEL